MSPVSYRALGQPGVGIAYDPTGWIAGQFIRRGQPAWADVVGSQTVRLTDWDGTERLISASVKVLRLPEHPAHHVLTEHLLMAGWRGVRRVPSKSKDVAEVVIAFAPDATDATKFTVPDPNRPDDRIAALVGDEEVGKFDRTATAITAWLQKEEA